MGSTMASAPTPGASRAAPTPTPRRDPPRGKIEGVQGHGTARPACTHRCGTTWAPSHAKGAQCWVCGGVGSGLSPRVLPLHRVRAKRCGHLVLLRTKSRPLRPRCGSPFPDMSRNQRGYLHEFPTRAPTAFREPTRRGFMLGSEGETGTAAILLVDVFLGPACPGTKEATSKTCRHGPLQQSREPPTKGFSVACALVSCDACVLVSVQVPAARPT